MYNNKGYWNDWSVPVLVLASAGFIYVAFLLILALCHIAVGQQMNLHWLHKVRMRISGEISPGTILPFPSHLLAC
ncbi:hypothetical protein scyTo_0022747 [Scyliorhinus torazame]|uniref:Protein S-acyltransferase n=1 Tax=Scyliorhinus torazame TaxID=75743 RepID=A0A401Q6M5_SCYTO|nr:hypothetical protein [Scyliorhinus torazame]